LKINELVENIAPPNSVCERYFDGKTCVSNPLCGWCNKLEECVEGDKLGSLGK